MKFRKNTVLIFGLLLLFFSSFQLGCFQENELHEGLINSGEILEDEINTIPSVDRVKLEQKAKEAKKFCKEKNYNQDFCILIDMSLHSGVNRFFVWDFEKNKVIQENLVSHGCCLGNPSMGDASKEQPEFSNTPDSHCSSLGKYLIGERGYSQFGVNIKYLLHGLESTNNNALKRVVVFHSWGIIPNEPLYPKGTPESWGCPAISDAAFLKLDKKLKESEKVLMWIFV